MKNTKERLFEVMGKLDESFKSNLNENSLNFNNLNGFERFSQSEKDLFGIVFGLLYDDDRIREVFPQGFNTTTIADKFYKNTHQNIFDELKKYANTNVNPIKLYHAVLDALMKR